MSGIMNEMSYVGTHTHTHTHTHTSTEDWFCDTEDQIKSFFNVYQQDVYLRLHSGSICCFDVSILGTRVQIIYFSKSSNTTLQKYSVTSKSPAFQIKQKYKSIFSKCTQSIKSKSSGHYYWCINL